MIKNYLYISIVFITFLIFMNISSEMPEVTSYSSGEYYINNSISEINSKNTVTGIYLDYRFFDTIFEASILLITVNGILYLSKFEQF